MTPAMPGSFIWYDLLTSDPGAAANFYRHVIGWQVSPMGDNYTLFATAQGPVAGTTKLPEQARQMGAPPHWTSNVHVADVDATVAAVKRLGGKVYAEPADHPGVGRLAVIADPQGATIHVFTPSQARPTRDISQHGEMVWHELISADHEAGFAFYSQLFGWKKSRDYDMGPIGNYLLYNNGGPDLGGMFDKPKEMPASAWMYYVQVDDLAAALERAKEKGGAVLHGPMEVPGGAHIAQLADPQGAMFSLYEMAKK